MFLRSYFRSEQTVYLPVEGGGGMMPMGNQATCIYGVLMVSRLVDKEENDNQLPTLAQRLEFVG